jgi:hypothetical protein
LGNWLHVEHIANICRLANICRQPSIDGSAALNISFLPTQSQQHHQQQHHLLLSNCTPFFNTNSSCRCHFDACYPAKLLSCNSQNNITSTQIKSKHEPQLQQQHA